MPLLLSSPAIQPGGVIPSEYTCDGADISPPLSWAGIPDRAQSLVLIVEDPDAPSGVFRHWAAFDIPISVHGLAAGYGPNRPASGFREAQNDFGVRDYGGPCPPKGHGTHHYRFRLFAISQPRLDLALTATASEVLAAAEPYVIQQTELISTYQR
ncbi:MAG TPA: YbhB/YbcL family Raf kinase inhibitor-like protein [Stellaceae bacterium]|nr:YbhB/YbcL family Raf kinase inhibitor-like protein [Stellaceae bacterium]